MMSDFDEFMGGPSRMLRRMRDLNRAQEEREQAQAREREIAEANAAQAKTSVLNKGECHGN